MRIVHRILSLQRGCFPSPAVSREILQQNRMLTSIRTASVKKILSELKSIASDQPEQYLKFITQYNRPLKEGLYGDFANRETLLDLVRFKSIFRMASIASSRSCCLRARVHFA